MSSERQSSDRGLLLLSSLSGLLGGLCCLTPIVMVLLGLSSIAAANSLGNWLYGDYKWHFRVAALVFLILAAVVYFRGQGICTLDQAKRQRNRILNTALLALSGALTVYVFWTYVVLHYLGIVVGLPWAQWDESWAIPTSAALAAVTAIIWWLRRGRPAPEPEASSPALKRKPAPAPATKPAGSTSYSA
ncbi:MAG: hypothetical protein R2762_00480 [Bryobacteraceae bacterium]